MRLTLHIFRKDARRLWWEVVVTVGLLAALANLDLHRLDAMPSPMEGLFNLMLPLPLAWAYLVALAVQEESPVGDRQFWVTRPYPWPALLAAKALFVIAFIHVPLLLADAAILWVRDFPPLSYLPQLLSKQLLLAGIRGDSVKAEWLMLILDRSVYDKLKDDKTTLNGKVAATLLREGAAVRLAIGGSPVTVPGAGRCSAVLVHHSLRDADLLKVVCESPSPLPPYTRVNLVQGEGVRVWKQALGDSGLYVSYPTETWLSPLNRRQTFFQISEENRTDEGSRWLVPRDALSKAAVEIVAEQASGCVVFDYQLRDLALRKFLVK